MMHFEIIPVAEASVVTLMKSIDRVVINPIIFFLFALAMVYFLYGVAQYFLNSDNEEVRSTSKSHMLWGVIGLFVMVGVFGIMNLILSTVGAKNVIIDPNTGNYSVSTLDSSGNTTKTIDVNGTQTLNSLNQGSFAPGATPVATEGTTVSTSTNAQDKNLDPTKSPFPAYDQSALCWQKVVSVTGATEYAATHPKILASDTRYTDQTKYAYKNGLYDDVHDYARGYFLANVAQTINNDQSMPVIYGQQSLYSKADSKYYIWLDLRAPINGGKIGDCSLKVSATQASDNYKYVSENQSSNVNLSIAQNATVDFTKSPFPEYIANSQCWRQEVLIKDTTEYKALEGVDAAIRKAYLSGTGQTDTAANKAYPTKYSIQTAFDSSVNQTYYVWVDARAPIGKAPASVCNLALKATLPKIANESTKQSSLIGSVSSDDTYWRVVDSGVSSTLSQARTMAITNALIQIASLKNVTDITKVSYTIIPPEKYFPLDPATGNYDYFVAVQSAK